MGKHAQSSAVQSSVQYGAEGSVLQNLPSRVHPAENLLKTAVWWIDAAHSTASGQSIRNLGWGGAALDAQAGSGAGADSNDPKYLDWQGENYVYLPGVAGNYMSVPDEAALDITGSIDIRAKVAHDTWSTAATNYIVSKVGVSGNYSYGIDVYGTGIRFLASSNGTALNVTASSSASVPFTAGTTGWVRVTANSSTGDVIFYTSTDGVTWTQLGTTQNAGAFTLFSGNTGIGIGGDPTGTGLFPGKVYRAIVKNGIEGTTVLDVDCSQVTSGSATSFKANTGQTVTINRSSSGRKAVAVTQPCWLFGTDDYLQVADNDLLDFGASDSLTVFAVFREWHSSPVNSPLLAKNTFGGTAGWMLWNWMSDGKTRFTVSDGTTVAESTALFTSLGTLRAASGVLNRSAGSLSVSLNGTPVTTTPTLPGSLANSNHMRVGSPTGAVGSDMVNMEIISAAVFRKALTASEISLINDYYQGRD